jgi:hypothetical protein
MLAGDTFKKDVEADEKAPVDGHLWCTVLLLNDKIHARGIHGDGA